MTITYRERVFLDKYRCIDKTKQLCCDKVFNPSGTSLYYCMNCGFVVAVIGKEDIIEITED